MAVVHFQSSGTEAEHSTTVRFRVTRNFDAGVVYAHDMHKALALANWRVVSETRTRPALSLSLGSDRMGSVGEGIFLMASKNLMPWLKAPTHGYVGVGYSRNHHLFPVGGGAVRIAKNVTGTVQFDGSDFHPALGVRFGSFSVALIAVKGRDFGFNIGIVR